MRSGFPSSPDISIREGEVDRGVVEVELCGFFNLEGPQTVLGRLHELLQVTTHKLTYRGHVISIAAQRAQLLSQSQHDLSHQSPNIEVPSACVAAFHELLSCLTYIYSLAACFLLNFVLDLLFVNQSLLILLVYSHLRQEASPFLRSSIVHVPQTACAG